MSASHKTQSALVGSTVVLLTVIGISNGHAQQLSGRAVLAGEWRSDDNDNSYKFSRDMNGNIVLAWGETQAKLIPLRRGGWRNVSDVNWRLISEGMNCVYKIKKNSDGMKWKLVTSDRDEESDCIDPGNLRFVSLELEGLADIAEQNLDSDKKSPVDDEDGAPTEGIDSPDDAVEGRASIVETRSYDTTFWKVNGSVVSIVRDGKKIKAFYEDPSENVAATRVPLGTVKFNGMGNGNGKIYGTAYVYNSGCSGKAFDYRVNGAENASGTSILLKGSAPILDPFNKCEVAGYSRGAAGSDLPFRRIGRSVSARNIPR
ncbi:hypothetical protein [Rhodomicrobium sp.]|uniref:hypothetical protein n=1 Tax=Rhodomicrobium sp. TaxID=2720632 RepID=UPI0039E3F426